MEQTLTDTAMWDLVVGFLMATFILPVLQQPRWSDGARAMLTFACCVIVGLVTAWLTGAFTGLADVRSGASSVLLTLVSAISSYKGFAKPVGIAPAIEHATALGSGRHST